MTMQAAAASVQFEAIADDVRATSRFVGFQTPAGRAQWKRIRRFQLVFILILTFLGYMALGKSGFIPVAVIAALTVVYLTAFERVQRRLDLRRQADATVAAPIGKRALGVRQVRLEGDGLRHTTRNGERFARWFAVSDITVYEEHLFITWADAEVYAIPRRAFPSEAAFSAFVSEANRLWSAGSAPAPFEEELAAMGVNASGVNAPVNTPANTPGVTAEAPAAAVSAEAPGPAGAWWTQGSSPVAESVVENRQS